MRENKIGIGKIYLKPIIKNRQKYARKECI